MTRTSEITINKDDFITRTHSLVSKDQQLSLAESSGLTNDQSHTFRAA